MTLSVNDKNINIPYENIATFQLHSPYILELEVVGTYNIESNEINIGNDYFRVLIQCIDATKCFEKIRHFMNYHIHFNMFNLKIIEIYDNLREKEMEIMKKQ